MWGLYNLGCSHIANNLGSHRVQTSCLCIYLYLLLYTYKVYMINISTSLYVCLGNTDNNSDYYWLIHIFVKGIICIHLYIKHVLVSDLHAYTCVCDTTSYS